MATTNFNNGCNDYLFNADVFGNLYLFSVTD